MLLEDHFGFNTLKFQNWNPSDSKLNSEWEGEIQNQVESYEIILKVIMSLGKILQETG